MTDQDTIFNNQQQSDQTTTQDQSVETPVKPDLNQVFAEHLSQIKNENGEPKYSDVFTALNALKHTQDHVKTLEEENRQFREEQIRARTMDDVLQQLTATQDQEVQTKQTVLDAESVKGVTRQTLQEIMAEQAAVENQQKVVRELETKFGSKEKAEQMYLSKAQELGIDPNMFNQLAATSPKAVLNYFDIKGEVTPTKNVEGSVNTEALQANQSAPAPKKNIMYGASSADVLNAWRAAGQAVQNEMETN